MTRPAVYICAPFRSQTEEGRRANVTVAMAMSRAAVRSGRTPVVVHATVEAGGLGSDDDPEERRIGLEASQALAEMVALSWGEVWICPTPAGGLSLGMASEVLAFVQAHPQRVGHEVEAGRIGTAAEWIDAAEEPGRIPALCWVSKLSSRWRVPRDA